MSADRATVLVIGRRGQVGRELMAARPPAGISRMGLATAISISLIGTRSDA